VKKVNILLFITGVALLLFAITIILFVKPLNGTQYVFLKVLCALAALLLVSQIRSQVWLRLGTRIRAAGACAFSLIIFFLLPKNAPQDELMLTIRVFDREQQPIGQGRLRIFFTNNAATYEGAINNGQAIIPGIAPGLEKLTFQIVPEISGYTLIGPNNYTYLREPVAITVDRQNNTIQVQNNNHLPQKKFAVVLSGNIKYTRDILLGFNNELLNRLPATGYFPNINSISGSEKGIATQQGYQEYMSSIKDLFSRDTYDYYVSIGTQASQAMRKYLDSTDMSRKQIFLGVTEPIDAGLVRSPGQRNGSNEIAGVSYCGPVENIALKINDMFPNKKLIYFYCSDFPQDESIANTLQRMSLFTNGLLEIKRFESRLPTLADFPDAQAIYFSWYTLEKMFEHKECKTLLAQRIIIASTVQNVRERGLSPVGISTDDMQIGKIGAELIFQNIQNNIPLNSMNIVTPPCDIYINCRNAQTKGLQIDQHALSQAKQIFDCNDR
jgi:ABC-type uncharacterized transport system substrate-binding protein